MTVLVPIAMFGWIPVILLLFTVLSPRRAVITAFLGAWLFLPIVGYEIRGLPDYTKMSATTVGVLLAALLFDTDRLTRFKPRWVDLPIAIWCFVPFCSSISNGLGPYDGFSAVLERTVTWGLPYFIGRCYFKTLADLRDLAVGIVIGGVVYIPLCLFEIRMSPQLHTLVYGFHQHSWLQTYRFGGWRPTVFMQHGLMVGMWMGVTLMLGLWLWRTGVMKRLGAVPMGWIVLAHAVTFVLCKSLGAIAIVGLGIVVLAAAAWRKSAVPVVALMLIAPVYLGLRTVGGWDGAALLDAARRFDTAHVESLKMRLDFEAILSRHAERQPIFGWGGWGRNRPDAQTGETTITDSLWIIAFGVNGYVGLAAMIAMLLAPAVVLLRRVPPRLWTDPRFAPAVGLTVIVLLYLCDNMFNAMVNPIFMLTAGALGALTSLSPRDIYATAPAATRGRAVHPSAGVMRGQRPNVQGTLR